MITSISEMFVNYAISRDYIKHTQYEEYVYALNLLLNIFVGDITLIVIGCAMQMLWECIMFWLIYKALRKYCGGFHFSTSLKCYISSCVICPIVLLILRYVSFNLVAWSSIVVLAASLLFNLSPVAALNKPLDIKETVLFGRIARIIISVMISAYIIAVVSVCYIIAKIISLAIISVAIFAVIGKIQLKLS